MPVTRIKDPARPTRFERFAQAWAAWLCNLTMTVVMLVGLHITWRDPELHSMSVTLAALAGWCFADVWAHLRFRITITKERGSR